MPHYRLFILDKFGRITPAMVLDCPNDEEAVRATAEHRKTHRVELWRGERYLGTFGPDAPPPRSHRLAPRSYL